MSQSPPFVDRTTGSLDTEQLLAELYPLAGLVALFAGLALLPFLGAVVFAGVPALETVFTILSQLVLAVGAGMVLLYVVARGVQLAEA